MQSIQHLYLFLSTSSTLHRPSPIGALFPGSCLRWCVLKVQYYLLGILSFFFTPEWSLHITSHVLTPVLGLRQTFTQPLKTCHALHAMEERKCGAPTLEELPVYHEKQILSTMCKVLRNHRGATQHPERTRKCSEMFCCLSWKTKGKMEEPKQIGGNQSR